MKTTRRRFVVALATALIAAGSPFAQAQLRAAEATLSTRECMAIRRTIDDQRKALKSGDAKKAFSFA